jgi:hypothetical protein
MSAIDDHSETVPRNAICCLLALEIAEYDVRPVFDQIRSTQSFQKLLSEATAHAGPGDLISIVREDGALLSFLADPEECFAIALTIREAASTQDCYRDLPLRIGINLGTVEIAEGVRPPVRERRGKAGRGSSDATWAAPPDLGRAPVLRGLVARGAHVGRFARVSRCFL